ncbi:hypothetical protein N431DRAFT_367401 [Stipitochalara longipes BDJ]|nr:hypothetical protein N431DRAFT_367401 [Stipitochalara longipes BDJ]
MMIVGDSLSQGGEGDWTWRYRLWEWLRSQEVVVDFVGPFLGTRPQAVPALNTETLPTPVGIPPVGNAISTAGYALDVDPEFNPRHFTAVGRAIWEDIELISAMVERYKPEYLLVLLGFNDMVWSLANPQEIVRSMEEFVAQARSAKPDLKFAIGNVPLRAPLDEDLTAKTEEYNRRLAEAIPSWSTDKSPIVLVHMRESYSCGGNECPAGHDGLHPTTLGDFEIAHAFSRALIDGYKIGTTELEVPGSWDLPVRPIAIPKNIRAVADAQGVTVTWDMFYGARGYDIQSRVLGEDIWIQWRTQQENLFQLSWNEDRIVEMEFKVRMSNGNQEKGEWSRAFRTCRPWSSLSGKEKWDLRWWFRKIWTCG